MRGGGWVLDVDIQAFFDNLDHGKLREMLRQRVTDGVVGRLIGKWLKAGVLEDGAVRRTTTGTPQGGVISPLLADIYLHEVVDGWWVKDVQPRLRGKAAMVRYADDMVMVFASREDALRVQEVLTKRLARFGLTLHPEKTRLIDFRSPGGNSGGEGPGSFDFLGFTHYWYRTRKGWWAPKRRTAKDRFSRALKALKAWMRYARILPIDEQAKTLRAKLRGHYQYYGIAGNAAGIGRFHHEARRLWRKWLSRRSQTGYVTWEAFARLERRHQIPPARLPRRRGRGGDHRFANP
jgi:group II intron reverse transcriptase/maturase